MREDYGLKKTLKVPRSEGEMCRRELLGKEFLDMSYEIVREGDYLLLPLKEDVQLESIRKLVGNNFEIAEAMMGRRSEKKNLQEILKPHIPSSLLPLLPKSLDIVGSVAIVELKSSLEPYSREIGEALKVINRNVETVLSKSGPIRGDFRTRTYKVIAGSGKTETLHRENGCRFILDVTKVFFSPRLAGERMRVAAKVREDEQVLDMFAGVGPFTVLIAKLAKCKVTALEINPHAYDYLLRNVSANGVADRVTALMEDAAIFLKRQSDKFDRVVMNLPDSGIKFLGKALNIVRQGGTIHLYSTDSGDEAVAQVVERVRREVSGRPISFVAVKRLREISARKFIVSVDLRIG